jgi:ABC-type sugar transport system ATPase subunit
MVREPKVFLFDEPLSNLDAKLRNQTRVEIKRLQRQLGATVVFVTHDQVEAMTLADKIVVLNDGQMWHRSARRSRCSNGRANHVRRRFHRARPR